MKIIIESRSLFDSLLRATNDVQEMISHPIVLLEAYRDIPNGNIEILIYIGVRTTIGVVPVKP